SYKLQRELDMLPTLIEKLEEEIAAIQKQTTTPEFYLKPFIETQSVLDGMAKKQGALYAASERWLELEVGKN
ncbi:MAG: ABC transporter ATP-binding protein, partial [Porticoccus sp.]